MSRIKDEIAERIVPLGFKIIEDTDVRIYYKEHEKTVAAFNKRHGEVIYTPYLVKLVPKKFVRELYKIIELFQIEYIND